MKLPNRLATFVARAPEEPPGGVTLQDPVQQQQADPPAQQQADQAVQQQQQQSVAPSPEDVKKFLESMGLATMPREQIEAQQRAAQEKAVQDQIARDAQERQELAELQHSDPEAYQQKLDQRISRITQQRVEAVTSELRNAPVIVNAILSDIKSAVPNLPQAELDKIVAEMTAPGITTQALEQARQSSMILNYAKAKGYELGISSVSPNQQRPPNTPASSPGASAQKPDPRTEKATMMAAKLGVKVEDILGSEYLK